MRWIKGTFPSKAGRPPRSDHLTSAIDRSRGLLYGNGVSRCTPMAYSGLLGIPDQDENTAFVVGHVLDTFLERRNKRVGG